MQEKIVLLFVFLAKAVLAQVNYLHDEGKNFCKYAPFQYELNEYIAKCPDCKMFTRPLREIKECCEGHPAGEERINCLETIRQREVDVTR